MGKKYYATNISYDVDIEDVYNYVDELTVRNAAEKLCVPELAYSNMTTEERHDYIYDLVANHDDIAQEILELPSSILLPDEIVDSEDIEDYAEEVGGYISNETGFCHTGFEIRCMDMDDSSNHQLPDKIGILLDKGTGMYILSMVTMEEAGKGTVNVDTFNIRNAADLADIIAYYENNEDEQPNCFNEGLYFDDEKNPETVKNYLTRNDYFAVVETHTGLVETLYELKNNCFEEINKMSATNNMTINLGVFDVDVQLQDNGMFDVYIGHAGSSGLHYQDVTADQVGQYVAEEIKNTTEHLKNEISGKK